MEKLGFLFYKVFAILSQNWRYFSLNPFNGIIFTQKEEITNETTAK